MWRTIVVIAACIYLATPANCCLCIDGSGVNIRSTPCGTVIGSANTGACYDDLNESVVCTLSGVVYTFRKFNYGGTNGWAAGQYLTDEPVSRCQGCSGMNLISRAAWGARPPNGRTNLATPTGFTVIHHSAGNQCSTQAECSAAVRGIQNLHMDTNGWVDIGYNFLIGGDGNVYEGRGWDTMGAHSPECNSRSHGTCHLGTFTNVQASPAMMQAQDALLACGVSLGKIVGGYTLHGHRDCTATACPGDQLYAQLRNYPNFGGPVVNEE